MKNLILNFFIVFISVIFSLLAFEGFLRIKDSIDTSYDIEMWKYSKLLKIKSTNPLIGHVHKKNSSAILQKIQIRTNNLGIRGEDIYLDDLTESEVLLFLGSSVLLGWGVEEDLIYTSLIEKDLTSKNQRIKVINAGIGNYNAERYIENYFENLAFLNPYRIVVNYFVNDSENLKINEGNFFTRNFHFAVMIWKYISSLNTEFAVNSIENYYEDQYKEDFIGFIKMKNALKKLSIHCEEKKIHCSLLMIPDIHQLNPYKLNFIHEKMEDLSSEFGFEFLNLLDNFEGENQEVFWNDFNDPHPNQEGHKRIAEAFIEFFLKNKKIVN